jgi:hypothetical protein
MREKNRGIMSQINSTRGGMRVDEGANKIVAE